MRWKGKLPWQVRKLDDVLRFHMAVGILLFIVVIAFGSPPPAVVALGGSSATVAVVFGASAAVCSVVSGRPVRRIQCWSDGQLLPPILPTVSFDAVAGGLNTLCGVRSGGFGLVCFNATFAPKRIYNNASYPLTAIAVGGTQICSLTNATAGANVFCWRGNSVSPAQFPDVLNLQFLVISSGLRFSCGVLKNNSQVLCWGGGDFSSSVQSGFGNTSMADIQVGGAHACGLTTAGIVICSGDNSSGQLNVPENSPPFTYSALSLGANHTCAIRRLNHTVLCWGGNGGFDSNITAGISFVSIVSSLNYTCGLTTSNFSVICWGPGWPNQFYNSGIDLPLQQTLPGPCVTTPCECNIFPQSPSLCSGNGHICDPCEVIPPVSPPSPPPPLPPSSSSSPSPLRKGLLAFVIIGSVGSVAGICSLLYCLWAGGVVFGKKKIHNTVRPTITGSNGSNHLSRSSTVRRQGSILMRRQRSGTSSKHPPEKAEEFAFSHLAAATDDFSLKNKIGAGSFGVVYRGKLPDGREVAIKRSESGPKAKKFQEKESAFESELAFLSRVHHKNLVRLVGYCEEREERLLVYEYMKNGALYDHLHGGGGGDVASGKLNSWKLRIKISLDAARGIEYLHNYAVPSIIHRDIKSSNILIDSNWTARVSDFGLSLMGPDSDAAAGDDRRHLRAAGTVGYIDPEYYGLNVLTAKSDVYGFGVVLLEVLTGKRAIFKSDDGGGVPMTVVDYAVPAIMAGEVERILDRRVGAA
ncbi:hypothetical protein M569_01779, partial [Genlisea aurea]